MRWTCGAADVHRGSLPLYVLADRRRFFFDAAGVLLNGLLKTLCRILYFLLDFGEFGSIHFTVDVRLDGRNVTLQAAKQVACRTRDFGEPLRAQHDQRHDADDGDFREAHVQHGRSGVGNGAGKIKRGFSEQAEAGT